MERPVLNERILHQDRYAKFGTLLIKCEYHPEEPVRYWCRDCFKALCAECIVGHAKHDFVAASNQTANELRRQHIVTEGLVNERLTLYEKILAHSEKKLVEMDEDTKLEFKKLSMAFTEIREAIFRREVELKKEMH